MFLPDTRTDQKGEYRFEHLCNHKFAVFLQDPRTGYSYTSPYQNEFLSGILMTTVRLNWVSQTSGITGPFVAEAGQSDPSRSQC
jgi:hypothetical protein